MCVGRAYAQTDTIRYVRTNGSYSNNGRSWATAKNNVQDAINDLRDYLKANNLTSGSVYIAAGTYVPTESTESSGGSMLNTSFKIYGGIHVYGGFDATNPEATPGERLMSNGKICSENKADPSGIGTTSGDDIASQWDLANKTILSGSHSSSAVTFEFDSIRGKYNATFPASSYHVVWFGTNGKYETANDSLAGHYKPLEYPASVDGCVIKEGNASSRSTTFREHTAFGGGAYLVGNAELRNCTVEKCNATLRGGGVYLDGGGVVEYCYIHTCQSPGVGVVQGYGGGACIEYDGQVGHSHITNCAARCGGGLAICHLQGEYPVDRGISYYSPFSTACVINNNTASAEAGGVYMAEGGTINHATVTANNCISQDVTYYGRRHGRSGGIYIRECGMVFNSVFWGNKCATNNDIQFASVRQLKDTTGHQVYVYHSAFMNHDISDWTGVQKEVVFALDKHNMPVQGSSNNFPCFFAPTVNPNNWSDNSLPGAGVFMRLAPSAFPGPRIWHLTSYSALDQKGVQVTADMLDVSPWLRHAHTDVGVVTNPYEPASTLGALVRKPDAISYALVAPQGQEGRAGGAPIPTLFLDPDRKGVFDGEGNFVPQNREGSSWTMPLKDIGEAIRFFRQYLVGDHYEIPALDGEGLPTGSPETYSDVQILIKQGEISTAGPGNYREKDIRTAAIRLASHMRLYGGYPSSLTGVSTDDRNPRDNVTTITANVLGVDGAKGYENNSAHVIALINVDHVIVDGFTLSDANSYNTNPAATVLAGGGVLINNSSVPAAERIHMVGNQLRNCVITNCSSPEGAAVYVNGEHSNGTEVSYAELKLVNCVIRNNTADNEGGANNGIITAHGRAFIELEHCDVVNNVGYAYKSAAVDSYNGYIRANNSLIFCNGKGQLDNCNDLTSANVLGVDGADYVIGEYNLFDADITQTDGFFSPSFSFSVPSGFVPSESVFGAALSATLPSDKHNTAIFTRTDNTAVTYPGFVNPSRNIGVSTSGDKPLYGGTVSYGPLTTNPCVNAANEAGYTAAENYDRTDNWTRDRGGAPDIGALENLDLPASGTIIYVTPTGAGKRDGSSWSNAIAGNTVYRLYGAPAAEGDSIDAASGARLINKSSGEPVTTEDIRYCGGFAIKYIYPIFHDYGKSYVRDIEIDVYEGGANAGLVDTLSVDTTSTTSITEIRYNNGIIPDTIVSTKAINADYPYGEMSGTSRYIYRAQGNYSPLAESNTLTLMFNTPGMTTPPNNAAGVVNTGQLTLTNERKENYVSGLQYAVEKASMANKAMHKDSVQVWIGAGKYSDYKGYVMRDSVSVYGGFPTGKYAAPGMNERRALMSNVVSIPKSSENANLDAEEYESILQISDINPKSGSGTSATINTEAIKFYDNGQSVKLYINNNISNFTDNNTIHYYQWDEGAGEYVINHTDNTVVNSSSVRTTWSDELYGSTSKTRKIVRKRVLQMPDVTSTVYADGLGDPTASGRGKIGDPLSHYERVIKEGRLSNVKTNGSTVNGRHQDPNYKEYNNVYWDGFTIRHGFIYDAHYAHAGGAGVSMFEGARLVNCIVTDNFIGANGAKGVGVFCDGSTSTIENCFILNNTLIRGTYNTQSQQQGAGLFLYEGTCFNSLIANNWANGPGGGLGLCVGKFYNNTLAYNTSNNNVGGLRIATGSEPALFMANCIIYGNNGLAIDITDGSAAVAPFINCYVQSASQITKANFLNAINEHTEGVTDGYFGRKNTFLNKVSPTKYNTPFAADINAAGNYSGNAKTTNDFALRQVDGVKCINSGEEDFEGAMYEAVRTYLQRTNASLNPTDANIRKETFYKNVVGVVLPQNDVVYAKRIQDCQVDIGAYEFNAAYAIRPDTTTHPGQAIFYVRYNSPGGDASSRSPENAACSQKLQQILDAAGRYKNNLMTNPSYSSVASTPVAGQPDKSWTVEVWLEGDNTNCTTSSTYADWYTPTRSTKHGHIGYSDNLLDYSFIIPHGIQVKGGYSPDFYHYEDGAGNIVSAGTSGAILVDERDPLTYRSVLSGQITSSTGATGNCYHVVTFTDDLYDLAEDMIDDGGQLAALSALSDAENHRAVLDGLFIEEGFANSPDEEDRIGAAAVVASYGHIRNCVVQNNSAEDKGGGLYLKPNALVSGTIIKNNTADVGGGIYIEAPLARTDDSLAYVISTTVCDNSASTSAGGVWFDETYARVNSSVLWHNTANDLANVSGTFSRTSELTDYPFTYCAVESRRVDGLGNIELSPSETEGVRWDASDPFNAILYYPIEMSSTLSRAGMTYKEWDDFVDVFPTLDSTDIAGVSRLRWSIPGVERGYSWGTDTFVIKDNDFIEIGARAINKSYGVNIDPNYVMRRLYVMHTELLNSDAARTLQNNTNPSPVAKMYSQMGSCMLNPFHRLGDAFDYIIAARKKDPERYRNARFEVYVEKGTYYPYHNAYGEQDEVRTNTFLIPEATTVIGGVHSQLPGHNYCQAGYVDRYTNTTITNGDTLTLRVPGTDYVLDYALSDSIRLRDDRHRPMSDYNLNSVVEPWELDRQTILSGNAVSGQEYTHVYHVITVHADSTKIGAQPLRYAVDVPDADWQNGESLLINPIPMSELKDRAKEECDLSMSARAIILDGLSITGGYANELDTADLKKHPYHSKTYFRGGGIFVDGNWTQAFDQPGDAIPNVTDPAVHNIPLIVRNCQFQDNMAGNGGAIYSNGNIHVYSSHFTQNYSQGPMTEVDKQYIPWSAGGCIAANAYCGVVNVLFDNNEAKRGLYPIHITGPDSIPDADARQGFGGVLSIAQEAKMRVANCHFMKNKAVAYSAIYNFLPNNEYSTADSMQFAFNSIFWGNEVYEVDNLAQLAHKEAPTPATEAVFASKFKHARAGVFHYDGNELDTYNQLYNEYKDLYLQYVALGDTFNNAVTDKLAELRAQGNKMEGLYFCSYRNGYGPLGMKPSAEGFLLTEAEQRAYTDPRQLDVPLKVDPITEDIVENYVNLFTYVHGNNNVLINKINTAPDGPNFKQPSILAGLDGYMQNADWLVTRVNLTTDQGWGHLKQKVERIKTYYSTLTGSTPYTTADAALAAARLVDPSATLENDVYAITGSPVASFDGVDQTGDTAMFNFLSYRTRARFGDMATPYIPIGNEMYMAYSRDNSDASGLMYRISPNPRMNLTDVYVDLGVYEYQYVQLDLNGNEVDTMWVATVERPGVRHDGLTWETPTTDLQGAIDLLMSSHNNHDKYICFLGSSDQSFAPMNVRDNRRTFLLTSSSISPLLPDSAEADNDYYVNSITFLGGYNYDVKDAPRDPQANPTVIEMPNVGNPSQLNQLFVIEDMTRMKVQANWMGEHTTRDTVVIPVAFDGITFVNPYSTYDPTADAYANIDSLLNDKGGAAIYYRWQRQYEAVDVDNEVFKPNFSHVLDPDSSVIDGHKQTMPKLTISNCIFMDNGSRTADLTKRSPAVRIDHGGGSSLIVNSLFHSNAGNPIYAKQDVVAGENDLNTVPNDVVIVNSTFALNDGHITLEAEGSELHNSLIWLDDLAADTLTQLKIASDQWDKDINKNKVGIADRVTHNAIWGCFQDGNDTYHNESLSTGNYEVFDGPCFISPNVTASTSEQRRARDFRLNPGVKTLNMADTTMYHNRVFFRMYPDTSAITHNKYWRRAIGFKSTDITTLKRDSDLSAKPRLFGEGMERGAYECQAVLQRVVYVQPNMPAATAGDGSSWQSPFGQGQLQNALDVAALYTYMNREIADRETRKSYVFVKGSYDANDVNTLLARDGVNIYGSLPGNFNDTAWINPTLKAFTNAECQRFVNYVRAISSGVASPNATPTRISTLEMPDGETYNTGFLMDGFIITNPGSTLTQSPVVINDARATVRNCIITDNTVNGAPVVDVRKGLLYNSLCYNNAADTVVKLGAQGLALNNTVIAMDADDIALDITQTSADASVNNIAGHTSTLHCLAPYISTNNPYTLPAHLTQNGALAYQLHEHSALINAGTEMDALPSAFASYKADSTIHFGHDRDLLGNPRRLNGIVDKGAYETWRIAPKQAVEITALSNPMLDETDITLRATDKEKRESFLQHYGGNQYPHAGSVVYLMDSSALTMQYETAGDFLDLAGNDIILRPGYMLLKPGASFYGNGYNVQMSYVAAEKRFLNQQYSMTAFPFAYSVADVVATRYYSANDSIAYLTPPTFSSYKYNGVARSAKDYSFQTNNSALWESVANNNRAATDGYLMDFGATVEDTVLRFTGFGAAVGQYVYTEDGDDKIVYLDQHDNRTAGVGSGLNFTRQEDMGWNMKGLPWLVSGYRTDTILWADNYLRQMHIPHVLYQMDDAGDFYQTVGDNVYTTRSWDRGNILSMGNAFLTQTATTQDREQVLFHLPLYFRNEKSSRPLLRFIASHPSPSPIVKRVAGTDNTAANFYSSDILTAQPDSTASKNISYSYGRDGLKWQSNENIAQIYMLDNKRQSRISLLGAAPTEVDIPLGVKIPENVNDMTSFTFQLPEKEAFAGYAYVWLIDYKLNRFTNLLDEDCEVSLEPGENNTRFALRIGGFPKTDSNGNRKYVVYTFNGTLYVRGLVAGDKITIYSRSGQLVHSAVASGTEFTMPLFYQNGYVVKVNDVGHKVLNM